jgi:hypothetical protein
VIAIPAQAKELPGILAQRTGKEGVTAYVCSGHSCAAPETSLAKLEATLAATETRA